MRRDQARGDQSDFPGFDQDEYALAALALGFAALVWGRCLRRIRRAHFGPLENALSLLGLPLFAYLLVRSHRGHSRDGQVTWKGRAYM